MSKKKWPTKDTYPDRILKALIKYTPELCAPCKCHIISFTQRHDRKYPHLAATAFGEGLDLDEMVLRYETRIQDLKETALVLLRELHKNNEHAGRAEECSLGSCKDIVSRL